MIEETRQVAGKATASQRDILRKHWWVLVIVVLLVLVGIIYLLSRLSAADSEMYPTTMRRLQLLNRILC